MNYVVIVSFIYLALSTTVFASLNRPGIAVLCIVFSGPAHLGVEILSWNNEYITGPIVIIAGPLLGVFMGVLFGLFLGIFTYAGLRVYSCFRVLELEYVPVDAE